jgi:hypothetical protein
MAPKQEENETQAPAEDDSWEDPDKGDGARWNPNLL